MIQSFYTASSGLSANKLWLSVISDNIANVNTIGFKSQSANFENLVSHSLTTFSNGSPKNLEIGGGSFIGSTTKDFSQGTFMNTNNPTDLALDGEGFFMVKDSTGVVYYTRNGQFRLDSGGELINTLGMYVQGWRLDDNGNMAGTISSIDIPMNLPPEETTQVSFETPTNLSSTSSIITANFDPDDSTTYHYVNSITIYDSLGESHELSLYFAKTGNNQWKVYAYLDGTDTNSSTTLSFNSEGVLTSGSPMTVSANLTNGANNMTISIDFSKVKQVASDFIFYAQQDGNSKGDIMSIAVNENGLIRATYTNGKVKNIARLAIATFKDKEMLITKGNWLYLPNTQTYTPVIMPGGVISKVRSGMLEMSNVDIAHEFINLITAQRAYQANARIINTDDQMLRETMNIKR